MRLVRYSKNLVCFFAILFIAELGNAQGKHSIEVIANPLFYKLGNVSNQYTIVDNDFVIANYHNKPGHEIGLQYSLTTNNKFSYFAGFSWLHRKHEANYLIYGPNNDFNDNVLNFHEIQLTENLIGVRLGSEFSVNHSLSVGLGLSFYAPLEIMSNMPTELIHYTRYGYNHYYTPDSTYSEVSFKLDNKIQRSSRTGLIIPDIYVDHKLSNRFTLRLGCRFKIWKTQEDWMLKYEINGFTESSNINNDQLLFSSRIDNTGFYIYSGIKYSLPLTKKKSPKE